jgi:hypothetical protein
MNTDTETFVGTPKDWAVSKGLAKPGKGRMSREAHEAFNKAVRDGLKIVAPDGPVKREPKPVSTDSDSGPVEDKPKEFNPYADAFICNPIDSLFVGYDDGKKFTIKARNVCKRTGYSIAGCGCAGNKHITLSPNGNWIEVMPSGAI